MTPILYTFRRCPYAMRARLAIASAGLTVELREITLRNKPAQMLEASPKGTVPVLITGDGVIEESLDIMTWALAQNDPAGWLEMPDAGHGWIAKVDGPFKSSLDRYKYASRFEDIDARDERDKAAEILRGIEPALARNPYLFGDTPRLADMATVTFVRQYAHVDLDWFNSQPWVGVRRWLDSFKASDVFSGIMTKYTPWQPDDAPVHFPA